MTLVCAVRLASRNHMLTGGQYLYPADLGLRHLRIGDFGHESLPWEQWVRQQS